jgi:NADH-quinone oxidoreductase subunit A
VPAVSLWPLGVYFLGVLVIVAGMLGLSYFFGQRHTDRTTGDPFESGVVPTGSTPARFNAKFYLNAVFFVIFDLESMFIFAWALTLREAGWAGYTAILIFIAVLVVTLIYLWRAGALEWRTSHAPPRSPPPTDRPPQ